MQQVTCCHYLIVIDILIDLYSSFGSLEKLCEPLSILIKCKTIETLKNVITFFRVSIVFRGENLEKNGIMHELINNS